MNTNITIGVYGISSQSGRAFFADYLSKGYDVIGYARNSTNGNAVLDAIHSIKGIYLERPENSNNEKSRFVPFTKNSTVTNDLSYFVQNVDIIIIALPSIYQEESVRQLNDVGIWKRRIPIVLSPSRTIASPYLWDILGDKYPIVCFSTCPYSCKVPRANTSLIKRRKRTWVATLEGDFAKQQVRMIKDLFPQAAVSRIPALTSLNNIGAIFHCATYVLNYDEITRRQNNGDTYSFYMEGIAQRHDVGKVLEEIDQIRLQIAHKLDLNTFGLKENPREDIWRKLTNGQRALEEEHEDEIEVLRSIRRLFVEYLNNSIISAQHWLDITYGVIRHEGECLSDTIGRTPTYQKNSVPQFRYVEEDIPTGLVPYEALANMLDIKCNVITDIINKGSDIVGKDLRESGRNLKQFSKEYIVEYLKGNI